MPNAAGCWIGLIAVQEWLWHHYSNISVLMLAMPKTCLVLVLSLLSCSVLARTEDYPVGDLPFRRYVEEGRDGNRITFYLSTQQAPSHPVPLIVWVQGTGCSSHFVRVGERISRGLQGVLYSVARGRARVLAVEKPGVEFLDYPPDDAETRACRPEFLAQFTLDRWATTIADTIQAAQKLPGVDSSKTLVIGISEGGIVAMRVSNVSPHVTHAASLSGGGPVYLFHMAEFMRSHQLDAEKEVYGCWS